MAMLLAMPAIAQGGYSSEKHPEFGIEFSRARDYNAVPVQPSEEWTFLFYAEKEAHRVEKRKRFRPELRFALIDHTPPPVEEVKSDGIVTLDDEERAADKEKGEDEETLPPITNFETFSDQILSQWIAGKPVPMKERTGFEAFEYELRHKSNSEFVGAAFTYSNEDKTIAVYGWCAIEDLDDQRKIWRKMLKKVKFYEPEKADTSKLERYYARRKFKNPEYRIRVREQLVKGWEAEDTENYLLVFSTKDEPLIRLIKSELESIRKEYEKLFPPKREITAVSTVRICKDEEEYFKYGGPRGSGGYWSAATEELVFFDYQDNGEERGTGKDNTRVVLYHEAFHQYIYYTVGKVAPHSWFNEGTGDYFSGAVIKGGKVIKIGLNTWRLGLIQYAVMEGDIRYPVQSFDNILNYSQAEFYSPGRVGICYAQAWSMIYFLRKSKVVKKHPVWSQILGTYFDTLQRTFSESMKALPSGEPTDAELEIIKLKAREAALDNAFSDVDLFELEDAWREFVSEIKPPR